jgi:hypothetical protein
MSNKFAAACLVSLFWLTGCTKAQPPATSTQKPAAEQTAEIAKIQNPGRVVRLLVALCDNDNQGIVPVPAFLVTAKTRSENFGGAAAGTKHLKISLRAAQNILVTGW